ncbi:MAG: MBL fold metallo-hydrolase [Balneolales bacterium]
MQFVFLGTGTSMGVPVAGGFGREIPTGDPRDERYRCSAWVKTPQASILIDIGPEFRLQTLRSGLRRIDLLLITHEHNDHIGGLDDLRPFNFAQQGSIPVWTTRACNDALRHRFFYMFGPRQTPGSVDIDIEIPAGPKTFKDCIISPLPVKHGRMDVMGFRINDLSYVTDVNHIPDKTAELIKGSKVLVLSGLRWEPDHPTHFTIPQAIEVANKLDVERTYLIHMASSVIHEETSKRLPDNVMLAHDQLTVEI